MRFSVEYVSFPTRDSRTRFVAARFKDILIGDVLDVGCFEAPLRNLLTSINYTGIDMHGKPDIRLNLEEIDRLPMPDAAFDCVMCIHVLEHLNNLHALFKELVRVSRRYLIVALPNCWRGARRPIARGKGSFRHYGLPLAAPSDRHKWFFSVSDAEQFLEGQAAEMGLLVREIFVTDNPKPAPLRWIRQVRYPGVRYYNRYSNTMWVVFEKPN